MNNKHQELIDEKVAEFKRFAGHTSDHCDEKRCFGSCDLDVEADCVANILQDTIDKVLGEEREELKQNLHDKIKRTFNGYGGVHGFTRFDLHDFVDKALDKALDKTPPNKV